MSSYTTHALCGAAGGLALARLLDMLPYSAGVSQNPFVQIAPAGAMPASAAAALTTAGLVVGSAFLALWPDIDESGSYIARRVRMAIALMTAPLLGAIGWMLATSGAIHTLPLVAAAVCALIGLGFIGPLLGYIVVRTIRIGAGGHRRLTHSMILGAVFGALAAALWALRLGAWAIIPAALVWGQVLHVIGDVVTPAGVPLLWPISKRDVRVLPRMLATYGEPIIAAAAVIVGFVLWTR